MSSSETTRVVVIGTGFVGSSICYAVMIQGLCSELVLIDVNQEKALGEAMDLEHGLSLLSAPMKVWAGEYDDCKTADIIVITAGLAQKPGQTRTELAGINAKIVSGIVEEITKRTRDAIILMVANPVDVMTLVALKKSGLPSSQVFGSGTVLDSARFRYFLSQHFKVNPKNIHGYIIGEHGDSEVAYLSHTNISGEPIEQLKEYDREVVKEIAEHTKMAAYEIIQKKGATYYGIGIAASELIKSILQDSDCIFPISTLLQGQHGISDICLSVPSVIGRGGVKRILDLHLSDEEKEGLIKSAESLKTIFSAIGGQ